MTKILGVNGSRRKSSHTRKLLSFALEQAKEFGGEVRMLDLAETPLALYHPEEDEPNPVLEKATEMVLWADAFILGSPDYHGSMSGVIKNFLDHYWREFTGKLFGYVVASHEKGLTVQDQLRTAVRQCYGWSLPYGIGFNGDAEMEGDGNVPNAKLAERTRMMSRDLVIYGGLIRRQFLADLEKKPRDPGFAQNFKH